ncbi:MAG: ATP-binding protein [Cyanobacteria bacterium P01_A01_bin.123]
MTQSASAQTSRSNLSSAAASSHAMTGAMTSYPDKWGKLLLLHSVTGEVSLIQWPGAEAFRLNLAATGSAMVNTLIANKAFPRYWESVQQVLTQGRILQATVPFQFGPTLLTFDLSLHPVLGESGQPEQVMAIGQLIASTEKPAGLPEIATPLSVSAAPETAETLDASSEDIYHDQLTQITWNIRRTLDLDTIWQQTATGLGAMLGVSRCLICSYREETAAVKVEAEYSQTEAEPFWLGQLLHTTQLPCLDRAIACLQPIAEDFASFSKDGNPDLGTALAIATCYQDMPNGLIVLYSEQPHEWTPLEIDAIGELADQVGTAIAHATLFSEGQALAVELQRANDSLIQKHRELEDARRQAEDARTQAEEASRLKSEFLANTSHELRTPLNGMIGFLKLVLDGMADDPEEQEDFIREAHQSALHLLNLINDVLDIAKIEAGKMQIDMGTVELKELFSNVENFSRPQAEQKGLGYEILMPATRDAILLQGNYQRLLQVMLNLVGNGIKFTHEGGISISAEVKHQKVTFQGQEWPGTVKISVADTGIGVSLEKQDRLFQTFSQVDGERTRQYGGTGLGLAISQKLIEAMGGVVQFISMGEGLGSTVTFTVLLYQEPVVISAEPISPPTGSVGGASE